MIDLTELETLIKKYGETLDGETWFTLPAMTDDILRSFVLNEFLTWLKAQQEKQHTLKDSYSMPRKNAPAVYTQECSCGETFSDVTEEAAQWLFDRHMPQQGGTHKDFTAIATPAPQGTVIYREPWDDSEHIPFSSLATPEQQKEQRVFAWQTREPAWSSTLPTESGLYWSRDLDRQPLKSDATWLERSPDGSFNWAEVFNPGNNSDVLVSRELEKREWWPIPLTAPGE